VPPLARLPALRVSAARTVDLGAGIFSASASGYGTVFHDPRDTL
jgi:hypothetical protein